MTKHRAVCLCLLALALLALASAAPALELNGSGEIVNWGFTPFGSGPFMGNWTNGAPPLTTGRFAIDQGEDAMTAWVEGNNAAPIDYGQGLPYTPSSGRNSSEDYDIELLAWRLVSPDRIQALAMATLDPTNGAPYLSATLHLGDVFIDVDNDGVYDRALTTGQWYTPLDDPLYTDDDPLKAGDQIGYNHKLPLGVYSLGLYHGITMQYNLGYGGIPAVAAVNNPFALMTGADQGGNLVYTATPFNYGTVQGADETKTWIVEWTFDISALGPLPVDPETGQPSLKRLRLHLTSECGNDFLDLGPRDTEPGGSIGDTVYWDQNNNGAQEPEEPGIAGVTVMLQSAGPDGVLDTDDDILTSQVTDGNGKYEFIHLPPGLYNVFVDSATVPTQYTEGLCELLVNVDLQPGQCYLDADFCYIVEPEPTPTPTPTPTPEPTPTPTPEPTPTCTPTPTPTPTCTPTPHPTCMPRPTPTCTPRPTPTCTPRPTPTCTPRPTPTCTPHPTPTPTCTPTPHPTCTPRPTPTCTPRPTPTCTPHPTPTCTPRPRPTCTPRPCGTGSPGYWMNHPQAWPVTRITIGGIVYSRDAAIALMRQSGAGDKTYTMLAELVSAKLNVLAGNNASRIQSTIGEADSWMRTHPVGSDVRGSSSAWRIGEPLATRLDAYNNGLLGAPHRH